MTIKKNDFIGIVGASGSGKSTLINLILGLIKPKKGEIIVDNNNINHHLNNWQSLIGYIPQDIFLLDDSLRNNVAFGVEQNEIDDAKILDVLKIAQLNNFFNDLKDGLNHMIGENGVKLSGGQKQRLGIARALYKNPKVLILDESTSALDQITEKDFLKSIHNLKNNFTIIFITHRISSVKNCNKIFSIINHKVKQINYEDLSNEIKNEEI